MDILSNREIENKFQDYSQSKINTGIQQLYIIGLYDALPVVLHVLGQPNVYGSYWVSLMCMACIGSA